MSRSEYEEDLHAELGYRTTGRRELSQRDWFSLRGDPNEAAPRPKAFAKLVNVLRAKKWSKQNPQRRREIANRYAAKPEVIARHAKKDREARHALARSAGEVFVCVECSAEWCRVPGTYRGGARPKFCTLRCDTRHRYLARSQGRRRHGPHTRLTEEQRATLLERYADGERARDLAVEYRISRTHVTALARAAARRAGAS